MDILVLAGALLPILIGVPIIWKTIIQPGAKRIAQSAVTGPILAELAKQYPSVSQQLDDIRERLDLIEKSLRNGK